MTTTAVPEMGRYLRQIVDNSFEEGQFESAVAMLDQLRSKDHKPSIIHILHLIFIALHSSQETQLNEEEPQMDRATLLLQSPRKIIKHTKASLILPGAAVIAAQQLLMSFIATYLPQEIGAALPFYPETKNEPPMEFEFSESVIFNQAAAIKHSKNCWEILKSSFTARATHLLGTPKGKGKQSSRIRFAEPSYNELKENEIKNVADDSWFVLEWLVALFEMDSDMTAKQGQQKHSPLLLKQLPPPPIGSTVRWDASEPLKIVFYSFQQQDLRRQRSGLRLLNLLVELTQTPHVNLPSFASTTLAQLATTSSPSSPTQTHDTPNSHFTTLFTLLPTTPPALSFKIALCKKIIEDASDASPTSPKGGYSFGTTSNGTFGDVRPGGLKKPRAQPRAITRQRTITSEGSVASLDAPTASSTPGMTTTLSSSTTPAAAPTAPPTTSTYVARLPTYAELCRLLRTSFSQASPQHLHLANKPWATHSLLLRVKFELLLAYALTQTQRREAAQLAAAARIDAPDDTFLQAVADGSLKALVDELFRPLGNNEDEDRMMFADVIRAVVGLPLEGLDVDEDME